MRCLSGTLMCRPHTSSDRDHVLLSIQKKIFSADNFTTKNIQSILYELFFKIFKNNHDTMRNDDDSETDEISYTNFNSQYLEDFRKNINSNFSNKAHSFVTDYSEINAENFINYIRQECLNEEIVRFGDKSCPFNSKERSDLYRHMKCIAGGIHMTLYFFIDLLQNKQQIETTDETIRAAFIHLLACINDLFLIPKIMDPSVLFCYVWYGNIHIENIYDFLQNHMERFPNTIKEFGIHPDKNSCMQLK